MLWHLELWIQNRPKHKDIFLSGNVLHFIWTIHYTYLAHVIENQISEFRIPNIYNEILFILFFAWSKVGPTVSSVIYNPL